MTCRWYLVVEDYDSMAGSFQNPLEDSRHLLESASWEGAEVEARAKLATMPRYTTHAGVFPRNPRLVREL